MYKSGLIELEAVVAIARLGNFRATAIDLDVSPTAIGSAVAVPTTAFAFASSTARPATWLSPALAVNTSRQSRQLCQISPARLPVEL